MKSTGLSPAVGGAKLSILSEHSGVMEPPDRYGDSDMHTVLLARSDWYPVIHVAIYSSRINDLQSCFTSICVSTVSYEHIDPGAHVANFCNL